MPFHNVTNNSTQRNNHNSSAVTKTLVTSSLFSILKSNNSNTTRGKEKFSLQGNSTIKDLKPIHNNSTNHLKNGMQGYSTKLLVKHNAKPLNTTRSKGKSKNEFKSDDKSELNKTLTAVKNIEKRDIHKQDSGKLAHSSLDAKECLLWPYRKDTYESSIKTGKNSKITMKYASATKGEEKKFVEEIAEMGVEIFYNTILTPKFPKLPINHFITWKKIAENNSQKVLGTAFAKYVCLSFNKENQTMNSEIIIRDSYFHDALTILHEFIHGLAHQEVGVCNLHVNRGLVKLYSEGIPVRAEIEINPQLGQDFYAKASLLIEKNRGNYSYEALRSIVDSGKNEGAEYPLGLVKVSQMLKNDKSSISRIILHMRKGKVFDEEKNHPLLKGIHTEENFKEEIKNGPPLRDLSDSSSSTSLPECSSYTVFVRPNSTAKYERYWCKKEVISQTQDIPLHQMYDWVINNQECGIARSTSDIKNIPPSSNILICNENERVYVSNDGRIILDTDKRYICPQDSYSKIVQDFLTEIERYQNTIQKIQENCGAFKLPASLPFTGKHHHPHKYKDRGDEIKEIVKRSYANPKGWNSEDLLKDFYFKEDARENMGDALDYSDSEY